MFQSAWHLAEAAGQVATDVAQQGTGAATDATGQVVGQTVGQQVVDTTAQGLGGGQAVSFGGNWFDLGTIMKNAATVLQQWGQWFVILLGVVMLLVGIFFVAKGLITHGSHGPGQTSWVIAALLIILGGAFVAGGWIWVLQVSSMGQATVGALASGEAVSGGAAATNATGTVVSGATQAILWGLWPL